MRELLLDDINYDVEYDMTGNCYVAVEKPHCWRYEDAAPRTVVLYDWNGLYARAEGCACLSPQLVAKDTARENIRELIYMTLGFDIEDCEIPEEAIDRYLESITEIILFDNRGNLMARAS